ncbi:MAG: cytidine deaminase [Thermoprotei archaeon]
MVPSKLQEILIDEAMKALANAYSPYSGIRVGAALLDDQGRIFRGCNIENSSYGLTVCAERVSVFNAVSNGSKNFRALCLVVEGDLKPTPCGACRQVLAEFSRELEIIEANTSGYEASTTLTELLPDAFTLEPKCDQTEETQK